MTYAARAATSPELVLYRTPNKKTKLRAAIFQPTTIYTARINQTFSTRDGVLEITYDTGSGTLADVLADMTLFIGSSAGASDVGIVRVRSIDATKVYIGETSDVEFADNQYLTIVDDFGLWARHVRISSGVVYMDGGTAYSDQHANFDPVPVMGTHRVLKLTGASVSTTFDALGSYCLDSSISAWAWSAPGSSSSSGMTTATPTISWNSVGWKKVYLTLTAANGKQFFGVRYVYVWSEASPPSRAQIDNCREDVDEGGWSFELTMLDECDLDLVRDHALVILFGEDYYGSTQSNIGPLPGCENIYVVGWINSRQTINRNPEQGSVRFNVQGAHHFFGRIPSYPDGVELVSRPPSAWTEIQGLTINKGLFHFLRWRTTATRIMDVQLTDNTFYTKEVSSLAQNLWEQLREMAFLQVFARAGVNALGQLYIEVHPQLTPEADRDWPTVMTITKADWIEEIDLERVAGNECAQVNLKGVAVNEAGRGTPYFSLSTGHTYSHYGIPEIQDNLLVSSQSQANQQCGLYFGWRNNPYPDIPIPCKAAVRLIDCFPRQKCNIVIAESDTPRGISYSGALIPKSVALIQDENGYVHSEVLFEAETFEALAVNGDVPGSSDVSTPPIPPLPPLPPLPPTVPGTEIPTSDDGPPDVIMHSATKGLLFTENFDKTGANVDWQLINSGLTLAQYQQINQIAIAPSGGLYVAHRQRTGFGTSPFIAYAPSPGSTFTIIEDTTTIASKFPFSSDKQCVLGLGVDPLTGQVGYVIGSEGPFGSFNIGLKFYVGSGTSFSAGVDLTPYFLLHAGSVSYGFGNWRVTGTYNNVNPRFVAIASGGGSVVRSVAMGGQFEVDSTVHHVPISTTDAIFSPFYFGGLLKITANGAVSGDFTTGIGNGLNYMDDNHFACDPTGTFLLGTWDVGARGKSSNGGVNWVGLPNLPFVGSAYSYDFAGIFGTQSRWVAARGSTVRYSDNFMDTPQNKEGNLLSVAPIPNIGIIKVVTK